MGKPEGYSEAWKLANADKEFGQKTTKYFNDLLAQNEDIIIDNINTTAKSRRKFIDAAQRKGYRVNCVLFPNDVETLVDRQQTRYDKTVPEKAVREQYARIQYPTYGECNKVVTVRTF
jgi:predicted kinase